MKNVLDSILKSKKILGISFAIFFIVLIAILLLVPPSYESHMSFLVRNERADPLISGESHQAPLLHADVTEEQINSEVKLLSSTEILTQVVEDCDLQSDYRNTPFTNEAQAVAKATRKLSKSLEVAPVRNASVIDVSYKSPYQSRSSAVLQSLAKFYMKQRIRVNNPGEALGVFTQQTNLSRKKLEEAEQQYAQFVQDNELFLLPSQKELTLHRLADLEQAKERVQVSLSETINRVTAVESELISTPNRITTQETSAANQYSTERLNTMLVDLENRRTDLKLKYLPDDPFIATIDRQITDTRNGLKNARTLNDYDRSTNVNPLFQALQVELSTLKHTKVGLSGQLNTLTEQILEINHLLLKLEANTPQFNSLQRQVKEAEENYLLYSNKIEQAKISNSLDQQNIGNVVISEPPVVPVLPVQSRFNVFTAFLLALSLSLLTGFFYSGRNPNISLSETNNN